MRLDRLDLADFSKDLSVLIEGVFGEGERDFEWSDSSTSLTSLSGEFFKCAFAVLTVTLRSSVPDILVLIVFCIWFN